MSLKRILTLNLPGVERFWVDDADGCLLVSAIDDEGCCDGGHEEGCEGGERGETCVAIERNDAPKIFEPLRDWHGARDAADAIKSLLFGAHQFLIHPICVALAWRKLYGSFPLDPRIWLAIFFHDWGYWGCPNMDGPEGKMHPWRAARWMTWCFDDDGFGEGRNVEIVGPSARPQSGGPAPVDGCIGPWGRFCLLHSRSLARLYDEPVSKLCAPDKIASFMVPRWVYLTGCRWSGELAEYMADGDTDSGRAQGIDVSSPEAWFDSVKAYLDKVAARIAAGEDAGIPPSKSEAWQ